MVSDEQLRHLSTKDFISTARANAKNWFEHALIDRLEQVWNERFTEGRALVDRLARFAWELDVMASETEVITERAKRTFGLGKD